MTQNKLLHGLIIATSLAVASLGGLCLGIYWSNRETPKHERLAWSFGYAAGVYDVFDSFPKMEQYKPDVCEHYDLYVKKQKELPSFDSTHQIADIDKDIKEFCESISTGTISRPPADDPGGGVTENAPCPGCIKPEYH